MPVAYVTVQLQITDSEVFDRYREKAGAALAKYGARPISAGRAEVLYDGGVGQSPTVLLEFPDADAARAWISDPELAETHALRNGGANVTLTLLPLA